MEFVGRSLALSAGGLAAVASQLAVGAPEIWAVFSVETHGTGFLPDRRPQILFERHFFARLTGGKYNASHPQISSPTPGGYGNEGAHQYDRLAQAIALDREAALQSASWGLAQVMGEYCKQAGFPDVDTMVAAMSDSEDAQLSAMAGMIQGDGIAKALAIHDWSTFARRYNGPNYAASRYDTQLSGYYQNYIASSTPDLVVRAGQVYLQFRGFDPHGVDGILGGETASAINLFQESVGMTATGVFDDATMQALLPA